VTNEFYDYPNLLEVDNYLEAAGIILAIKKGINLDSVKRPLKKIQQCSYSDQKDIAMGTLQSLPND